MNQNEQKMAGILLRLARIEQGKGQKEICHGICVTSYLSKIERGLSNPDEAILKQLFARLMITYETDAALIGELGELIRKYETYMRYEWGTREIYRALKKQGHRLKYSKLALYWLLIECREEGSGIELLDQLEGSMSPVQRGYYYLLKGQREEKRHERLQLYCKADELLGHAYSMLFLVTGYFENANYNAIHSLENRFAALALEEGNTYVLAYYYYLRGSAYACVDMEEMMVVYYERVIHLVFQTRWKEGLLPSLYYNMGSVYANIGKYALAEKYLDMADQDDFLLLHKKALVKVRSGNIKDATPCLEEMKARIADGRESGYVEKLMFEELQMECEPGFLEREEYLKLLEHLIHMLKKERHFGYLYAYRGIMAETCIKQRKYKTALEFERELSGKLSELREKS